MTTFIAKTLGIVMESWNKKLKSANPMTRQSWHFIALKRDGVSESSPIPSRVSRGRDCSLFLAFSLSGRYMENPSVTRPWSATSTYWFKNASSGELPALSSFARNDRKPYRTLVTKCITSCTITMDLGTISPSSGCRSTSFGSCGLESRYASRLHWSPTARFNSPSLHDQYRSSEGATGRY